MKRYFINVGNKKRVYFDTYIDAQQNRPVSLRGTHHIYPTDHSGYYSKHEGRISFGDGNRSV